MSDTISNNSLLRAAERVRAKRAAEQSGPVARVDAVVEPTPLKQVKNTTSVRAKLNEIPDDDTLMARINSALTALSRGVRWVRGSILNLLV